jgi:hypothetical protein
MKRALKIRLRVFIRWPTLARGESGPSRRNTKLSVAKSEECMYSMHMYDHHTYYDAFEVDYNYTYIPVSLTSLVRWIYTYVCRLLLSLAPPDTATKENHVS